MNFKTVFFPDLTIIWQQPLSVLCRQENISEELKRVSVELSPKEHSITLSSTKRKKKNLQIFQQSYGDLRQGYSSFLALQFVTADLSEKGMVAMVSNPAFPLLASISIHKNSTFFALRKDQKLSCSSSGEEKKKKSWRRVNKS